MSARLKHFGWGREGEGLTAEEEAFVMSRAEARFGRGMKESASPPRLEDIRLEAPQVMAPSSLPFCTSEHYDRAAHTYGKSYPELARALARDYASAPDVVAYPRDEADVQAGLGERRRRDRDAVRRRVERVRRGRVQPQWAQGRGHDRPAPNGKGQGGRQDFARRADRGRHLRPRARSTASPTWVHAAPLPAELRIFDARGLDCDARRRPLRHALYPHRRSRRIAAHRYAEGRD